jgi:hypothetical protein
VSCIWCEGDGSSAVGTLAGGLPGAVDGGATVATFSYPLAIALNPSGTLLYVADNNSHKVRVVDCVTGCTPVSFVCFRFLPPLPVMSTSCDVICVDGMNE